MFVDYCTQELIYVLPITFQVNVKTFFFDTLLLFEKRYLPKKRVMNKKKNFTRKNGLLLMG